MCWAEWKWGGGGRGHHQLARMTRRTSQLHLILYQPFSTSLFLFFYFLNVTNFQNHPEFFSNKAYQSISEYEDTISPLGNDTFIFIFSTGLTPQFSPQKATVICFWVMQRSLWECSYPPLIVNSWWIADYGQRRLGSDEWFQIFQTVQRHKIRWRK